MLSDDTGHLTFSIWCKTLESEANQNGRVGSWLAKFVRCYGRLSRPDDLGGKRGLRYTRFMASRMARGLCGVEVERGKAAQKFRASIQVKAGTTPAEVDHECC